jgi:hypothetical protein
MGSVVCGLRLGDTSPHLAKKERKQRTDWLADVGRRFLAAAHDAGASRADVRASSNLSYDVYDALKDGYGVHLYRFEVLCTAIGTTPDTVLDLRRQPDGSYRVPSLVQGVIDHHKEGDLMNRPDARTLVNLIPKLTDSDLEQLVFLAVELRRQRGSPGKAQPARKEQL